MHLQSRPPKPDQAQKPQEGEGGDLEGAIIEPTRYGSLETFVKQQTSMMHPGEDSRCFCCSWNLPVVLQPVCRCPLGRACTHCMFCLQFFGCCFVLSLPRIACIVDFFVTFIIYFGPMRRKGIEAWDYLLEEAWPYDFERSSILILLLALVRSITLFIVFAERRQSWTIAMSSLFLILTITLVSAKLPASYDLNRVQPLLVFSLVIATAEYALYWLVGRRRVVMRDTRIFSTQNLLMPEIPIRLSYNYPDEQRKLREMADKDSRFTEVQGVCIHYKICEGEAKARGDNLVLIHEFGSGVFGWKATWSHLKKNHKRILAFDLPGFGLSDRPTTFKAEANPYGEEFWLTVLVTLMDKVGLKTAVVVGHGMGGALAIVAANFYPKRVSKIVLVAPTIYRSYIPASVKPFLNNPPLLRTYYAKIQEQSFHDRKKVSQSWQDYHKMLELESWEVGMLQIAKQKRRYSVKAIVPLLRCPISFIHGNDDYMVPLADSELAFKNLKPHHAKKCTLTVMERCGHRPHEELPLEFSRRLLECAKV